MQEDNQNGKDGVIPLKNLQSRDEAIFEVQIILGATVGGKKTRYPKRRERRPAKMFKRGDGPEIVGRVTLMG